MGIERLSEGRARQAMAVLPRIRDYVAEHGGLDASGVRSLAGELGIAEARVRAVHSFFDDLHAEPNAVRICHGTSCRLGRGSVSPRKSLGSPSRGVFCLGRCYGAPNALDAEGKILDRGGLDGGKVFYVDAERWDPCPVYCLARTPAVTRRILEGDHAEIERAREAGVYRALKHALGAPRERVIAEMERAGMRGRGGAGFSVAQKWAACAGAPGDQRFVVVNGDEGDPGSFVDRVLMEWDPHALLEGLALCAYAVGAGRGLIYVRSEYPLARKRVQAAIDDAYRAGLLGPSVMGSSFALHVDVVSGMGSYVCGEETAMLNAIEGQRGEVRLRPPYPTTAGLFGCPTVVNNVETMIAVPQIIAWGADLYASLGTATSNGTKAMCLNHGFERPGIYEVEFGTTVAELINQAGGGRDGRKIEGILLGGPMGSIITPESFAVEIGFEAMRAQGLQLGHGGMVALLEGTDYAGLLRHCVGFMVHESCGKCLPCSMGSKRLAQMLEAPLTGERLDVFTAQLEMIADGSLCAFGQLIPSCINALVTHYRSRILES